MILLGAPEAAVLAPTLLLLAHSITKRQTEKRSVIYRPPGGRAPLVFGRTAVYIQQYVATWPQTGGGMV
ncbi:hypothetical protein GDO81_018699 [Engystomops pustulosus]|uniref:Secreted protein n=1 Tax=Engystomops pustulosus TaxID=76066 RepID=A0AAV6YD53_ENGPU|nr:hypothetical protein GDO81_018699 [Engystomops pustulosus]